MVTDKIKVLFVCMRNSARSQMAEVLLREIGEDRFDVESAGLEPALSCPEVVHRDPHRAVGRPSSGSRPDPKRH